MRKVSIGSSVRRSWMLLIAPTALSDEIAPSNPQRVDNATLPWSYDTTTIDPAVFVNVPAQGDRHSLDCRIIIDDVVIDERSVDTMNAYAYRLDKSG